MAEPHAIRRRLTLCLTSALLTQWWSDHWPAALDQLERAAAAARGLTAPRDILLRGHADEIVACWRATGDAYAEACARAGGMNLREAALRHARETLSPLLLVEIERIEKEDAA